MGEPVFDSFYDQRSSTGLNRSGHHSHIKSGSNKNYFYGSQVGSNMNFGSGNFNGSGQSSQTHSGHPQTYVTDFGPSHFAKWAAQHGTSANMNFSDTCAMVDSWIPDYGATTHMTSNPQLVQEAVAYTIPERVIVDHHGGSTPPHSA